uniref:Uncharacterized protein n=1 Tax=Nomascus leucogenys TaxID=61853 RepID=A0A2I3GLP9_NOMLE
MGAVAKPTFWEALGEAPASVCPGCAGAGGRGGMPPGRVVGRLLGGKAVTLSTKARSCQGQCRIRAVGGRPSAPAPVLGRLPGPCRSWPLQGRGRLCLSRPQGPRSRRRFSGSSKGCVSSQSNPLTFPTPSRGGRRASGWQDLGPCYIWWVLDADPASAILGREGKGQGRWPA